MIILAFETSCDDTSVALLDNDQLIALSTRTQLEHNVTGGVVPEVAARAHANAIFSCLDDVFREAHLTLDAVDLIACTASPGLAPSLLTGKTVAETLALAHSIPIMWIDHIEAHIFANFLGRNRSDIILPSVVLTLSGGHTQIFLWRSLFDLELLGQTRDDAVGEAYDKVAKMLGLGFPGGAKIANLAQLQRELDSSDQEHWSTFFPRAFLEKDSLDFSLSGLKSAVKRYIDGLESVSDEVRMQIAYAFEEAVFDVLIEKIFLAAEQYDVRMILLAGGVSANTTLKDRIASRAGSLGYAFFAPKTPEFSQDNAAMVGIRAFYEYQYKNIHE